jgi:hypothetical protein
VGLLARDDEFPLWIRVYDSLCGGALCLTVLGFGIAYIVMGNRAGQIVGICLVVGALAGASHWFRRRFRRTASS